MNRRSEVFDSELEAARGGIARWVLLAFIISLLIHAGFWYWANFVRLDPGEIRVLDRVIPRTFHLERVEIDPKLLEQVPDPDHKKSVAPVPIRLPEEKVAIERKTLDKKPPDVPKSDVNFADEKPAIPVTSYQNAVKNATASGSAPEVADAKSLDRELLDIKPAIAGPSVIEVDRASRAGGLTSGGKVQGFSNLDTLLAQTGPLTQETAPILMPTDLMFDYDKTDLRPEAIASLKKLAELIRRNPHSRFLIEGHTDSFGTEEYNQDLSRRRAESVKAWLTGSMGLPAEVIETRGYGKSRLLAPASGSVDEQKINRRVEIVIKAPATTQKNLQ